VQSMQRGITTQCHFSISSDNSLHTSPQNDMKLSFALFTRPVGPKTTNPPSMPFSQREEVQVEQELISRMRMLFFLPLLPGVFI